jgi:hypothetical protein
MVRSHVRIITVLLCLLQYVVRVSSRIAGSGNKIVIENQLQGTTAWRQPQSDHIPLIQGFTTKFSHIANDTIRFKIDAPAWINVIRIDIYRMGHYGGLGGRRVANFNAATIPQEQCYFEEASRMTDCSNWKVTVEWTIPATALSGVYVALPSHTNSTGELHYGTYIPFIVRQPPNQVGSQLLFKTADLTWAAYNKYGNWNLYRGNGSFHHSSRAFKASYNRPWQNRHLPPEGHFINFLFGAEYPMIYWLEKHGYDVSYCSCADIEDMHAQHILVPTAAEADNSVPLPHKVILSVGHDEYWTPTMKAAHEHARDHGVHLAFFSGNEIFWRVKWDEDTVGARNRTEAAPPVQRRYLRSISATYEGQNNSSVNSTGDDAKGNDLVIYRSTDRIASLVPVGSRGAVALEARRIVVCRKETLDNVPALSSDDWTGTFRDPRHRAPEDESLVTGQLFMVNAHRRDAISVSKEDATQRFWRDASFTESSMEKATSSETIPADSQGHNCSAVAARRRKRAFHRHQVVHTTAEGVLGYEWDVFPTVARPAGLFPLSTTHQYVASHLLKDYGAAYNGAGVALHRLSLYRHLTKTGSKKQDGELRASERASFAAQCKARTGASAGGAENRAHRARGSALVFGAGTVQWSWALSSRHDGYVIPVDRDLQQATLNLFADMGVFPSSLRPTSTRTPCDSPLVYPQKSSDFTPPTSTILSVEIRELRTAAGHGHNRTSHHRDGFGDALHNTVPAKDMKVLRIRGTAEDHGGGQVAAVEVSVDGGESWQMASGRREWYHVYYINASDTTKYTREDANTVVEAARQTLYRNEKLYRSGPVAANTTMLILSRAVDDSGWMESGGVVSGLCAVSGVVSASQSSIGALNSALSVGGDRLSSHSIQRVRVVEDNTLIADL